MAAAWRKWRHQHQRSGIINNGAGENRHRHRSGSENIVSAQSVAAAVKK